MTTYGYVRCRSSMQGHDWDDYGPTPGERQPARGHVHAHFRCSRCGMVKRYEINITTGQASKPQYFDRPKDYKIAGMSPAEWRLAVVHERKLA